jgi:flavin reductase (DIM6/NTAB) family NADH-FMN oxidoreductase RutF
MESFQTYAGNPSLIPCPAVVVGTYKDDGEPNFATSAWAGTVNGTPPILSVSFREATLTHSLLAQRREFTVSVLGSAQTPALDYVGVKTGRAEDKAAAVKWPTARASKVNAPYSPAFPLVWQCRLVDSKKLGLHTIYFGEIVELDVRADVALESGGPSLAKVDPVVFTLFERGYYRLGPLLGQVFELGNALGK